MSPFHAEVNFFTLAGDAKSFAATASPSAPDYPADAATQLRANVAQVTGDAKAGAGAGTEQARQETAQTLKELAEDKDDDDSDRTTSHQGAPKAIIVHKAKSKDGDNDGVFAAIPIVAIVFTFLYLIVRALMAPFNNRQKRGAQLPAGGLGDEEAAIVEKLQRTLAQRESRVESLETILIDQARNKEKYGTKL